MWMVPNVSEVLCDKFWLNLLHVPLWMCRTRDPIHRLKLQHDSGLLQIMLKKKQ